MNRTVFLCALVLIGLLCAATVCSAKKSKKLKGWVIDLPGTAVTMNSSMSYDDARKLFPKVDVEKSFSLLGLFRMRLFAVKMESTLGKYVLAGGYFRKRMISLTMGVSDSLRTDTVGSLDRWFRTKAAALDSAAHDIKIENGDTTETWEAKDITLQYGATKAEKKNKRSWEFSFAFTEEE